MPRRSSALAVVLLFLVLPALGLAGGSGAETEEEGVSLGMDKETSPAQDPAANAIPEREAGSFPASAPQPHEPMGMFLPSFDMPEERMAILELAPSGMRTAFSMDRQGPNVTHRGELDLDGIYPSLSSPLLAYGPNTPPPASGDWTVDERGNNVNNTTILLNGNLKVTTGELTLDNVSLVMNCMTDGQYGIDVSAGGAMNLTNCNVTAFNGSLHYKFAVHGNMIMDRCNVSEMWGDFENPKESGIALFSSGTRIYFSAISNGESGGVMISGNAGPQIKDTKISNNMNVSIGIMDTSTAVLMNCNSTNNHGNGIVIAGSPTPLLMNCTIMGNNWCGIVVAQTSNPVITNCSTINNSVYGIEVSNSARPVFTDCISMGNTMCGILLAGTSSPTFKNCMSIGNHDCGIGVSDTSTSMFMNCSSMNNSVHGILVSGSSRPTFTNCTFAGNNWSGIEAGVSSIPVFTDCSATSNSQSGIIVAESARPTLRNCIFSGNSFTGIATLDFSSPLFMNCTAANNSGHGIQIGGNSIPTISDCMSEYNRRKGVTIADDAAPGFSNTSFSNNSEDGIFIMNSTRPEFTNCTSIGNKHSGIVAIDDSAPEIAKCAISNNDQIGIHILESCSPVLEELIIIGNGWQNVVVDALVPVLLADSMIAGAGDLDILLFNSSNLTILNTTYTMKARVVGNARLTVEWYLTIKTYDRAQNMISQAEVAGTGKNGSRLPPRFSDLYGMIKGSIMVELIQNSTDSPDEFTYYCPYDFRVAKGGQTNTTWNISISRSMSLNIFLDFAPRIAFDPDITVTEDQPYSFDLTGLLSDQDNPLDIVGLTVDRDYVTVDNTTHTLTVFCPVPFDHDTVTITASDGLKSSNRTLYVAVTAVNDPPRCIAPIPDQVVFEDATVLLDLKDYFNDEESGTRLSFSCNMEELTIDDDGKASWTPGEGNGSLEGVVITASDGYLKADSNPFNINFTAVNGPPVYIGGLEDATVHEHKSWTADLDAYFQDEEDPPGMIIEVNISDIAVNKKTHVAEWRPSGNTSFSVEVRFTAHDAQDYSLTAESDPITLTYMPVNDPPVYLGTLAGARLGLGDEWNITLEMHFRDEDTSPLMFAVNNPNIRIIEGNKTAHYAVWKPNRFSTNLSGVVFTAYDGQTYVRSSPITLAFDAPGEETEPSPIFRIVQIIPVGIFILLPAGVIGGIAAFYAYRRVRYGKYAIEQLFLIYNDGRLIAHRQKKDAPQVSNEILTARLTALKGFIRESLQDQSKGQLDQMQYGDLKIALEHGRTVYLAAFISGYVTDKLKAEMKDIVQKVEAGYEPVLRSWDGMLASVEGAGALLEGLMGRQGSKPN